MMAKRNICVGPAYSYSSWTNYWEGTYKRDNRNLGRVSTQMFAVMGNYGITNNLNVLFSVPYVKTKASEGTMRGMEGFQDLSLWLKWRALKIKMDKGTFSLFGITGLSVPLSNYVADYLPLSIGLHNKSLSARVMADYQTGKFFVTGSGTYTRRSNVSVDRTSYYTTDAHLTNQVEMPDVASANFRTGLRSKYLIAEVVLANMTTLGGFDIRRNDMPFPSNKMIATTAGVNMKYTVEKVRGLELTAGANQVIAGRNVGRALTVNGGVFYIIDFSYKTKKVISNTQAL
ncbi:hypothetical protein SAE01_09170 [Segetibacter aerophilus]|uniref:DUF5723 domain-containing protein n=2 Tax=Segetibacter aerophilus TaxID=670293 RepID=A0A512B8X9_9BACT|nr:hypothetical protein SAE01_09170 [Segetibacter aerophilus]